MAEIDSVQDATTNLSSIYDFTRWAVSRFNQAELYFGHGTDNPWDEAIQLILPTLHLPPEANEQLLNARLTQSEKLAVAEVVLHRIEKRIPAAYITQQAWFCGLPFYVDERVLVPRSPIAELIENQFQPWLHEAPKTLLDLCTGSACIAIACAYQFPEAQVDAVDICADALQVADYNIQQHGLTDRVFPIQSDLFEQLQGQRYDLIVSNPPYVDAEDLADMPDEFHHEPELGLAAGDDGLDLADRILRQAASLLSDTGWLIVEVGNSMIYMADKYPGLSLEWIEFERGGLGVFAVNRAELVRYFEE